MEELLAGLGRWDGGAENSPIRLLLPSQAPDFHRIYRRLAQQALPFFEVFEYLRSICLQQ